MLSRSVLPVSDHGAAILAMLGCLCFLIPTLAAAVADALVPARGALWQVTGLLAQQVLMGGLVAWHLFFNLGVSRLDLSWPLWPSRDEIKRGLLAGFGLLVCNGVGLWLGRRIAVLIVGPGRALAMYHKEQSVLMGLLRYEQSGMLITLLLFTVVLVVPICEELFFRGYLYATLKAKWGKHAVWMSSLIFTVLHFYVVHGPAVFLMALGLTFLYEERASLWSNMLAHATLNALVAGFLLAQRVIY
jgi:membrane protease YdiL (CAAX protease family)